MYAKIRSTFIPDRVCFAGKKIIKWLSKHGFAAVTSNVNVKAYNIQKKIDHPNKSFSH